MLKTLTRFVVLPCFALMLGLGALMIWPQFLFAHTSAHGQITFWSDEPIDDVAAAEVSSKIMQRLRASPLGLGDVDYHLFVANDRWRQRLLWNVVVGQNAGGFAITPFAKRHVFLSGAVFETNTLIAPDGTPITAPRTLAYYGAHELTHLRSGEVSGGLAHLFGQSWAQEGLADHVALGSANGFAQNVPLILDQPDALPLWRAQGYYAHHRLLVQYLMEIEGWAAEDVLVTRQSRHAVQDRMLGYLKSNRLMP